MQKEDNLPMTRFDPDTGKTLTRDVRRVTFTYKGKSIEVDMPGWYPSDSNEGVHTRADCKVSDRALNRLKAEVDNLLLPEQIQSVRKSLNLTQEQAGLLLGGGPNAFQKYESGDILPSKAISNLLRVLEREPSMLAVLSA